MSQRNLDKQLNPFALQLRSLLLTIIAMATLLILPGLIAGYVFSAFNNFGVSVTSLAWQIWLTLLASVITLPILYCVALQFSQSKVALYLAVSKVSIEQVVKWLLITLLFWCGISVLGAIANLPPEPFMAQIKASGLHPLLLIGFICISAPILEELLFRGLLFRRLENSYFKGAGAVFISSLVFTVIHTQYQISGLIIIFLIGCYFGFIRWYSKNTMLSIIAHIGHNSFSLIALYLLN